MYYNQGSFQFHDVQVLLININYSKSVAIVSNVAYTVLKEKIKTTQGSMPQVVQGNF